MGGHWGNHYWPWFLIVASVAFLVPEILGILGGGYNTLSEYAWRELNVTANGISFDRHTAAWLLSLGMWGVFVFWITNHIWFFRFR